MKNKITIIFLLIIITIFIFQNNIFAAIDWDNLYLNNSSSTNTNKSTSTSTSSYSASNRYVYVTDGNNGGYYHSYNCEYVKEMKTYKVSIEWAFYKTKEACPYCKPFVSSENYKVIDVTGIFITILIIGLILVGLYVLIPYLKRKATLSCKNATNKILGGLYTTFFVILTIILTILPPGLYIYTVYYYATNEGMLQMILSMIFPVASTIVLFVELLIEEGIGNALTIPIIILVICFGIFMYLKKNNE